MSVRIHAVPFTLIILKYFSHFTFLIVFCVCPSFRIKKKTHRPTNTKKGQEALMVVYFRYAICLFFKKLKIVIIRANIRFSDFQL